MNLGEASYFCPKLDLPTTPTRPQYNYCHSFCHRQDQEGIQLEIAQFDFRKSPGSDSG
jgi:hypothetical protein